MSIEKILFVKRETRWKKCGGVVGGFSLKTAQS